MNGHGSEIIQEVETNEKNKVNPRNISGWKSTSIYFNRCLDLIANYYVKYRFMIDRKDLPACDLAYYAATIALDEKDFKKFSTMADVINNILVK